MRRYIASRPIEADAPPASDKAPATPNAVAALSDRFPSKFASSATSQDLPMVICPYPRRLKQVGAVLRPIQAVSPLQQVRQLGEIDRHAAALHPWSTGWRPCVGPAHSRIEIA